MKFIKLLYWRLFNRKRYRDYIRFNKIILTGRCKVYVPPPFINYSYHYFCMDMIDKGWKKEIITIEPQYEITYCDGTKEDVYYI